MNFLVILSIFVSFGSCGILSYGILSCGIYVKFCEFFIVFYDFSFSGVEFPPGGQKPENQKKNRAGIFGVFRPLRNRKKSFFEKRVFRVLEKCKSVNLVFFDVLGSESSRIWGFFFVFFRKFEIDF